MNVFYLKGQPFGAIRQNWLLTIVSPCATFVKCGLSVYQAANDPKRTLIEMNEGEVQRTLAKLVEDIKSFIK